MTQFLSIEEDCQFSTILKTEEAQQSRKLSDEVLLALPSKSHSYHSEQHKKDDTDLCDPF